MKPLNATDPKALPSWKKSVFKFVLIIFLVMVAAHLTWSTYRDQNPNVTIPTHAKPSPNAYDFDLSAANVIASNKKIAFTATNHYGSPNDPDEHDYTHTDKDALVKENAAALRQVRTGFAYPYVSPPVRSFSTRLHYLARFRGLARLFSLEGTVRASHGDWDGSISSDLDSIQFGTQISQDSTLIPALVGIACENIGRRSIWKNFNHLTAPQARIAAQRLERITKDRFTLAQTLQEAEWEGQASLMEVFRQPDGLQEFSRWSETLNDSPHDSHWLWESLTTKTGIYFTPKRYIFYNYTQCMDYQITEAKRRGLKPSKKRPPLADPITQILLPDSPELKVRFFGNETEDGLLTITLALHAYQSEHHAYPVSLTALAPSYLSHVPNDPFASSGTLKYHVTHGRYVLYSVGPDGKDDGGKPIFDPNKKAPPHPELGTKDLRYTVFSNSQGDIVAGINKW